MSKCFGIFPILDTEKKFIIEKCVKKNHGLIKEKTYFNDVFKFTCEKCGYHYYNTKEDTN